jgi:hypothetical protein
VVAAWLRCELLFKNLSSRSQVGLTGGSLRYSQFSSSRGTATVPSAGAFGIALVI